MSAVTASGEIAVGSYPRPMVPRWRTGDGAGADMVPPLWTMVGLGLGSSEIEVSQGFQSLYGDGT